MAILYLHLPFALIAISLVSTPTSCKLVESLVSTRENFFLKGHVIERQRTSNLLSCAHRCSRKEGCRSYNFKHSRRKGLCELSSETAGYFEDGLTKEAGWLYGQIVPIVKENSRESNNPDFNVTFTTLGAQGPRGPTDISGYQGTTLQGKVTLDNGIQIWQVPMTGSYLIEVWGASGAQGRGANESRPGGKGDYMKGIFSLTRGTLLKILVGQAGSTGNDGLSLPGGGGGGTFITFSSNTALIVAGGGGGGGAKPENNHDGDPGQITEEGSQSGGTNGTGGTILRNGSSSGLLDVGAGGGLIGDGENAKFGKGGKSFVNGGEGGDHNIGGKGGFGGGGWAFLYPGAGGGYSGGGVKVNQGQTIAGGGGSFNNGGNPIKKEGVKEGDGKVIITLVDPELQQN